MPPRRGFLLLAALVVVMLAAPPPATAIVLDEDEFADTSTEVGAIARSFAFLMFGDLLKQPIMLEDMSPTGIGLFDLRLYFVRRSERWKLVVHNQLTTSMRTHLLSGAFGFGRGVPPPRWLPLAWDLADDPTLSVRNSVDWLYAAWNKDSITITAGRQPVTFGRGKLWSPTDLVGAFTLTEVDTEYTPGADALRVDWSPSTRTTATLVVSASELADDDDLEADLDGSVALVRVKRGFARAELGMVAGYVRRDLVAGVDAVFDTGSFEVYGETTLTWVGDRPDAAISSPTADEGDLVGKAIVGATFRPRAKLTVSPELLYNGFGAAEARTYADVAQSERVAIGEQTTLGKLYLGGVADWEVHPLVHLTGMSLVNLRDPSALVSVGVGYSVANNVHAQLGGYVPIGKLPVVDLAALAVVPRDEYGLYPYFVFFELKAMM